MAEIGYAEEQISYELYVQWIRFASTRPASRWIGIELISNDTAKERDGTDRHGQGKESSGAALELNWSDTHRSCPDWH